MRQTLLITLLQAAAFSTGVWGCEQGVCTSTPGLVYDAESDACVWPDEIGCNLKELGYNADCNGLAAHDLKAVDFAITDMPEGRSRDQYFVVCVPGTTREDRELEAEVKNTFPHLKGRSLVIPTGPVLPRILGCPGGTTFNQETFTCQALPEDETLI